MPAISLHTICCLIVRGPTNKQQAERFIFLAHTNYNNNQVDTLSCSHCRIARSCSIQANPGQDRCARRRIGFICRERSGGRATFDENNFPKTRTFITKDQSGARVSDFSKIVAGAAAIPPVWLER